MRGSGSRCGNALHEKGGGFGDTEMRKGAAVGSLVGLAGKIVSFERPKPVRSSGSRYKLPV